ncbi:SDR family NAD(P)-dependent oxidoreductase [Thalassoroseus pseudoceratinae]|uniref:SDR family NAD(P)-dependent oxidoreductase n=1 Tax=Thalassoroseus pseudoceratinae TaxID=2713176 RepID=UPI001F0DEB6C|nr:SDR family oxidoreductase [Thalassoroseus pseudoceratinae]
MLDTYADRWALVTGASSGIGAAFARRLAARGMHLVLVARRQEAMEELAAELDTQHGTRSVVIPCDLSQADQIEELAAEIQKRQIEIELLINNAGFASVGEVERTDPATIRQLVDVNIQALTELTYRFLPQMLGRGHGAIVNVSSVAAFQPVAWMGAYAASKAYVLHFSESIWAEVRDRGVTVMALCPGVTKTNFFDVAGVPNWLKKHSSQTPDAVVRKALRAMEKRRLYAIPGKMNYIRSLLVRFAPRKMVAKQTLDYFRPKSNLTAETTTVTDTKK